MTDAGIFQILGFTYLAMGLGMLLNPRFYERMLVKMIENEAVLFLAGLLVLVLGCFMVVYHNVWSGGWTVVITVVGWLALVKGLMMTVIPERSIKVYNALKFSGSQVAMYGVLVLILGIVFVYAGCFV
jgi:uncharacterized protein YjeT (DUF2065 family)